MFIVFEGIDGCGKTTHSRRLIEWLESRGVDAIWTCEPFSRAEWPDKAMAYKHQGFARSIMQVLQNYQNDKDNFISPMAQMLIWCADRAQHIDGFIRPKLAEGKWVICDRYWYSTGAYQVHAGNVYGRHLQHLWSSLVKGLNMPEPDMAFHLRSQYEDVKDNFDFPYVDKSIYGPEDAWNEVVNYYSRIAATDTKTWRDISNTRQRETDDVFDQITREIRLKFKL